MAINRKNTTFAAAFLAACLGTSALTPAAALAAPGAEQSVRDFDISAQPLQAALLEFSRQSDSPIVAPIALTVGRQAPAVQGRMNEVQALNTLLSGSGLSATRGPDGGWAIGRRDADAPQSGSAAGDGADAGTVQALIVTAQKKEENIQDVPIAISAFTEKTLEEQKIEGGFDLLKAIPNVTFSKNNFSSYNFSIRGIGTKAVSATTDPGVAVSFNNIALIQNRLFEQEYFDVERVEVLRGPQGTLYGRNATAGVINVISAKPNMTEFSGWLRGEVGNYATKRLSAMVNVPIMNDKLAVRLAGSLTDRQGFDYNSITKNHINGRDLWSGRVTVAWNPTDRLHTSLVWERFNEDDNRSRTGKQLCHRDPGMQTVGGVPVAAGHPNVPFWTTYYPSLFSQGCLPGSLYEPSAFETPNGLALPFVAGMIYAGADGGNIGCAFPLGYDAQGHCETLIKIVDPYGGKLQSPDLRTVASIKDPRYRAKADVVELNIQVDLTDRLHFFSQTAYDKDSVYSFQDYNRFNTDPIFNDTTQIIGFGNPPQPDPWANLAPGGVFCDPQLGCSNTMAAFDISQARSRQFTQEVRLQSDFSGPLNFSMGANYTKFDVLVDYYVFNNLITAFAEMEPFHIGTDITQCHRSNFDLVPIPVPTTDPRGYCPYIDPNPIESIDGQGHNYFRSKNPYKLASAAAFGELYWQATDALKITAGLRYTDDRKNFTPVPSQVLLANGPWAGGFVNMGYPASPAIKQEWGAVTGRLGFDWKPQLSFTDQTMVYAFYSRGYKGGGANPPTPGFATLAQYTAYERLVGRPEADIEAVTNPILELNAVEYGRTFRPEYVNAYEIGAKNTLLGGALTLNGDAFFYDYKDYQVSQIRDRTAVNENFDARTWGLEFQGMFAPSHNLQFIANVGYLDTEIAKGSKSIDIMNRTQGHADWMVVKPWVQLPSNCILPVAVVKNWLATEGLGYDRLCGGWLNGVFARPTDPATGLPYTEATYPESNGGAGFYADLGGHELPNAPHWTMNLGAQYGIEFTDTWKATVRGDVYWQSQSWARVYNDNPYDKLHGWYNLNLSVWLENDQGLKFEFYAKNILNKTPITDAFLNSDDSDLTTNVFTLDPRLIGLSVKKDF